MTILYALLAATLGFGGGETAPAPVPVAAECQQLAFADTVMEDLVVSNAAAGRHAAVPVDLRLPVSAPKRAPAVPAFARFARFLRRFE